MLLVVTLRKESIALVLLPAICRRALSCKGAFILCTLYTDPPLSALNIHLML